MVDVGAKPGSVRTARATGLVRMARSTLDAVSDSKLPKGNVFTTAQLAGIQAAKRTAELIPLCHPLNITWADIGFVVSESAIEITAEIHARDSTGIEMEALTAVSVAALTLYDMCKSIDKGMTITDIRLIEKRGGKSSHGTDYRPRSSLITISDSVSAGTNEDRSGSLLRDGLEASGCEIIGTEIIADEEDAIQAAVKRLLGQGAELILTTGGTGLGPRDVTVRAIKPLLTGRLPGVEQALHNYGRQRIPEAMLSETLAGTIGQTIIVCLPGSPSAANDALAVLVPVIFHAFDVQRGAGHGDH